MHIFEMPIPTVVFLCAVFFSRAATIAVLASMQVRIPRCTREERPIVYSQLTIFFLGQLRPSLESFGPTSPIASWC